MAQAGAVTVFTRSTPVYGFQHNDIYLDDASLVVVGSGPAPAPTSAPGNPPAPTAVSPATPTQVTGLRYVVVPGDNYYRIARRFGISVNALLAANPDALYTSLFGGDWIAFVKQAAPFGLFSGERRRFVVGILLGEPEYIDPLGKDAPEGMLVTGYPWYGIDTPAHRTFVERYGQFVARRRGMGDCHVGRGRVGRVGGHRAPHRVGFI